MPHIGPQELRDICLALAEGRPGAGAVIVHVDGGRVGTVISPVEVTDQGPAPVAELQPTPGMVEVIQRLDSFLARYWDERPNGHFAIENPAPFDGAYRITFYRKRSRTRN